MDIFRALDQAGQNFAKGADEFGQGLAKGADEFGQNFAKGADEFGQGLAKGADEFGQGLAKGGGDNMAKLRAAVLSGCSSFCPPDDVGCAHALRCWLESAIAAGGEGIVGGIKAALDGVRDAVRKFAEEHSVLGGVVTTLLALAVMALLVPPCISALGFGAAGPVAGSWAAGWQSALGVVEAGSIFAFFQRLGMIM